MDQFEQNRIESGDLARKAADFLAQFGAVTESESGSVQLVRKTEVL